MTTVPTPADSAKFTTGDIIAKTATSTDTFLLIVKYDATTDKYERAFVYRKTDGSYYRKDEKTDVSPRSMIEKLYPARIIRVSSLSQVPVVTPTTATTIPTTTSTTAALPAPTVTGITPNSGIAGTTVNITTLSGTNFRPGVSVQLVKGTSTISASSVTARSATNITCIFTIPSGAVIGLYTLTVTNLDGQAGSLSSAFTVTNTTATTTPTTTATTAPQSPTITSIAPSSAVTGMQFNVTNLAGSGLLNVTTVKLTRSGQSDITATNITVVSSSQVTCTFNLAGAGAGTWNVLVTTSGGQSGIGTNLFTVYPLPPVAAFMASNVTGSIPLIVKFSDQSTGTPTAWSWSFGGSGTSTEQNPEYTYSTAGLYSVSLTVTNAGGSNTTTLSNYINATSG